MLTSEHKNKVESQKPEQTKSGDGELQEKKSAIKVADKNVFLILIPVLKTKRKHKTRKRSKEFQKR